MQCFHSTKTNIQNHASSLPRTLLLYSRHCCLRLSQVRLIALCIGHKQLQVFVQGLEYLSEGARANSPVHSDEKLLLAVLHLEQDVGLLSGISAEVPPEILKPCEVFLRLRSCSRLLWNNVRSCRAAAGAAGAASSDSDSLFA